LPGERPALGIAMRIITRPDFDGIVCAVLLRDAVDPNASIQWVEPNDMQRGLVNVEDDAVVANLPFHPRCAMWFDHHYTNRIDVPFRGAFAIAPSAAGIIHEYFADAFKRDYRELVRQTDRIDAARLTRDEVLHPEKYDYVLVSMTLADRSEPDEPYWNRLVELLGRQAINEVLRDALISERCRSFLAQNERYAEVLAKHTLVRGQVSITDLRDANTVPPGNRFTVYSMYPEAFANVKIRYVDETHRKVAVSVGHSIFNRNCRVNVGLLLADYEGGGHFGAGSCRFEVEKADVYVPAIIEHLMANEPNES
jgi:hypothetical protein